MPSAHAMKWMKPTTMQTSHVIVIVAYGIDMRVSHRLSTREPRTSRSSLIRRSVRMIRMIFSDAALSPSDSASSGRASGSMSTAEGKIERTSRVNQPFR